MSPMDLRMRHMFYDQVIKRTVLTGDIPIEEWQRSCRLVRGVSVDLLDLNTDLVLNGADFRTIPLHDCDARLLMSVHRAALQELINYCPMSYKLVIYGPNQNINMTDCFPTDHKADRMCVVHLPTRCDNGSVIAFKDDRIDVSCNDVTADAHLNYTIFSKKTLASVNRITKGYCAFMTFVLYDTMLDSPELPMFRVPKYYKNILFLYNNIEELANTFCCMNVSFKHVFVYKALGVEKRSKQMVEHEIRHVAVYIHQNLDNYCADDLIREIEHGGVQRYVSSIIVNYSGPVGTLKNYSMTGRTYHRTPWDYVMVTRALLVNPDNASIVTCLEDIKTDAIR